MADGKCAWLSFAAGLVLISRQAEGERRLH
jgi:hypothetical protein